MCVTRCSGSLPLLIGVPPDRRRRCPDTPYGDWRAVGFELQLIFSALLVSRGAGDGGNLQSREIAGLPARAVGEFDGGYRQAIDFRPVLGVELHAIDREQIKVVL